jgi:hypothetical protein
MHRSPIFKAVQLFKAAAVEIAASSAAPFKK